MPPRTGSEKILWEIWRKVLGLERVSVQDSFFEIGGDSILSIQVLAQAKVLVAAQGFRATTPEQVAKAAGLTVGQFHRDAAAWHPL